MGNCMVPASVCTVSKDQKCKIGASRASEVGDFGPRDQGSNPGNGNGGVRVKVVITKQELAKLLSNGLAMQDLLVELQARGVHALMDSPSQQEHEKESRNTSSCGWRPALESIPEDRSQCF